MKTRAEIYGNEATDLLRIVTMYTGLCEHQLLCFHPGKEDTTKALLSHLERQGRIFQTDGGGYFLAGQTPKTDHALVRAGWVLLDFIRRDLGAMGIPRLYLVTDHTALYERYGWTILTMVTGDDHLPERMYTGPTRNHAYSGQEEARPIRPWKYKGKRGK